MLFIACIDSLFPVSVAPIDPSSLLPFDAQGLDIGLFLPPLPEGGAHEEGGVDEE